MKRLNQYIRVLVSIVLMLTFVFSLYPVQALTAVDTPQTIAWEKASSLRETIMADVPECTWKQSTTCSDAFPLYDLDSNINGYVFEFQNGLTPAGFIQIDLSTGTAELDRYCFSGVHTAKILAENQQLSTASTQVLYLGGYSFLLKAASQNRLAQPNYIHLYTGESISADSQTAETMRAEYTQMVNGKRAEATAAAASVQPKAPITIKYVMDYKSVGWESYASVSDYNYNTCAPIAVTNICKYWAMCRGKINLFPNTASTYNTLKNKMGPFSDYGVTPSKIKPAWIEYVAERGFEYRDYTVPKNGPNNSVTFADFQYFIDWNRPFLFNYDWHAVAAFGYEIDGVNKIIIVADATSTSCVYLNWANLSQPTNSASCCIIPL